MFLSAKRLALAAVFAVTALVGVSVAPQGAFATVGPNVNLKFNATSSLVFKPHKLSPRRIFGTCTQRTNFEFSLTNKSGSEEIAYRNGNPWVDFAPNTEVWVCFAPGKSVITVPGTSAKLVVNTSA